MTEQLERGSFPVVVDSPELEFYLDNERYHSRQLTISNPYDMSVKFRIKACPNEDLISVQTNTSPTIAPNSEFRAKFTHEEPFTSNCDISTLFVITMTDASNGEVLGKRLVVGTLVRGVGDGVQNPWYYTKRMDMILSNAAIIITFLAGFTISEIWDHGCLFISIYISIVPWILYLLG